MLGKIFKLKRSEIAPVAKGLGGCLATDRITVDGAPVGYMYRDQPTRPEDSGWRFFAGDENNRGGIRITAKNLDGDNRADIVAGDGTGAGSRVTGYLGVNIPVNGTPPQDFSLDVFPGFTGGVFVG